MRVLLVSATYPTFITFQRKFLGLAYLHAYALEDETIASQCTIEHKYFEAMHTTPEETARQIQSEGADVVAFGCYVWNTKGILKVVKLLKELTPNVKVVLGGPEVSYHYTKILDENPGVDAIAIGEGEETFREYLLSLLNETSLSEVRGLAFNEGPMLRVTPPREYEKNLDRFPSPYLKGVFEVDELQAGAYFQTTRGCPFTCTYCDYGRNQPYFEFSMERVRQELEYFKECGARAFFCVDATFNYRKKRANEILQVAIDVDLKSMLWIELFPSLIDDNLVELLGKSHRVFCGIGVQTTNPVTMKNIHRVWSPEKITQRLDKISKLDNCYMGLELIMGLPGDNLQTFKECLDWAYARKPHQIFALNLQILPRTPLERQVKEFDIQYMDADGGHEVISNVTFSEREIAIGKAITNWHRLFQAVFFRLANITGQSPSELIEQWAVKAYYAGLYDSMELYHHNVIKEEVFEPLRKTFQEFVHEVLATKGYEDLTDALTDFFRYIYVRRARTREGAFIMDILDLNCIATQDRMHRILSARRDELATHNGTPASRIPKLTSELLWDEYSVDVRKFWSRLSVEDMRKVAEEPPIDVALFTEPKTGAGRAIVVDELSRRFLGSIDGTKSLADIASSMKEELGDDAEGYVISCYERLDEAGVVRDALAPEDPDQHRVGLFAETPATLF